MAKNRLTDTQRLINAFRYSFAGLKSAWIHEVSFRQEILSLIGVIPLAIWIGDSAVEWAILMCSYCIIPIMEIVNTSLETIVDRLGEERHALSARAKDLGSAAVFLSICAAVLVWLIIGCEHFF